ncbi:reverse transcriptase domain-containing protein [Roseibium album]|uniref:Retron-type reverse transcriptase n=1 Tax=Roseibium album TaxID=311410 RepID=A0A0M7ATX7_9HYPH|nr:reverse transcriptase domain-containing protein [Roseibium album]CTQ60006.1 Retron-type reverse transcriptase [Roseibium album]CTQ77044.1 Retron-type reverse transcriptase [Roseibium album]CTQ77378.1 Retron-type reverse transcriptase [Roseibium album]
MNDLASIINAQNARPIWRKLRASIVPIVSNEDYREIESVVNSLCNDIKINRYIPEICHGYLGYPKSSGCTRFVPIISKEDLTIYYLLALSFQDYLVKDLPGVYGAWRSVPMNANKELDLSSIQSEEDAVENEVIDPYFSDTLSKKAWFKNWSSFTELMAETCRDSTIGNYVLVSDIANFYDTIDINRLCENLRSDIQGHNDSISLLKHFLQYWDRRVKGYIPSSKGIPQEIISDASRMLANYYLRYFDEKFIDLCRSSKVTYIRWADDIVIFGSSPRKLENIMHRGSRLLLNIGLNLNAAKTRHYTRVEYREYRVLDLLDHINSGSVQKYETELKRIVKRHPSKPCRIDTVIKASLNMLSKHKDARTLFSKNFLDQELAKFENLSMLNEGQLWKKCLILGNIEKNIRRDIEILIAYPYAAPRATYISFLAKYNKRLVGLGLDLNFIRRSIEKIKSYSGSSEIVEKICCPRAVKNIG